MKKTDYNPLDVFHPSSRKGGPRNHSAATSHLQNDKYMEDFDKAWHEMNGLSMQPKGKPMNTWAKATAPPNMPCSQKYPSSVTMLWSQGPSNPDGVQADISNLPSLCSAANWAKNEVVIGSSDHALYIVDATKGTHKRTLYTKTCGHTEWVSCVTYLPDGRIVSGGMDAKMWLWPTGSVRGIQMEGHSGPISKVEFDSSTGGVISASYDKTVRLWNVGARCSEIGCMSGHDAPVLELGVANGKLVSGDRSGNVILWDPNTADASWRLKNIHKGHVTSLAWGDDRDQACSGLFFSGGQDGYLRVWDPRTRENLAKIQLHVNEHGRGAVSQIIAGGAAAAGMVVSSGADGTCRILDPKMSYSELANIQLTNFPYSMAVAGGLALVGCGDGAMHVIDIVKGTTLYALGAHKGAVRSIDACEDRVITSGDDGNTMLYYF